MKKLQSGVFILVGLVAALTGSAAWAQSSSVEVNIPFAFMVGAKELPPGRYEIRPDGINKSFLTVRGLSGGAALSTFEARSSDPADKDVEVVFSKAYGKSYLSEVHIPGAAGFVLRAAPRELVDYDAERI